MTTDTLDDAWIEDRIRRRRKVEALPRVLRQQARAFRAAGDGKADAQLRLIASLVEEGAMTFDRGEDWRIAAGAVLRRRAAETTWTS